MKYLVDISKYKKPKPENPPFIILLSLSVVLTVGLDLNQNLVNEFSITNSISSSTNSNFELKEQTPQITKIDKKKLKT